MKKSTNGKVYADFYGEKIQLQGVLVNPSISNLLEGTEVTACFEDWSTLQNSFKLRKDGSQYNQIGTAFYPRELVKVEPFPKK